MFFDEYFWFSGIRNILIEIEKKEIGIIIELKYPGTTMKERGVLCSTAGYAKTGREDITSLPRFRTAQRRGTELLQ